jgi:hypothetical protein
MPHHSTPPTAAPQRAGLYFVNLEYFGEFTEKEHASLTSPREGRGLGDSLPGGGLSHVSHVGHTCCLTFKFFSVNSVTRFGLKTSNISAPHHRRTPTTTAGLCFFKMLELFRCDGVTLFNQKHLQV